MLENKYSQLLINSITAALKAGEEIIKIYETDDFNVEMKSDNSPLTKADKASHKIICEILGNHSILSGFQPNHDDLYRGANALNPIPILSEEGKNIPYEERKNWKQYWLIDPLDGTKEFIKRNGEFTVNIALIENNQPVLGVIYAPEYGYKIKDKSGKDKSEKEKDKSEKEKDQSVIPDPARPDVSAIGEPESQPIQVQNENGNLNSLIRQFVEFGNFAGTLYFSAKGFGAFKANYNSDKEISIKKLSITQSLNHPVSDSFDNNYDDELEMNNKAAAKLNNLVAVGSRSHSSEEEKTKLEELGVTETISVGSSLKFCMVAEGNAQVYYRHGPTMEWDVAAGYAIAKEAGAKITGLQFNKENLLNGSFLVLH